MRVAIVNWHDPGRPVAFVRTVGWASLMRAPAYRTGAGFLREQGEQAFEQRLGDVVADVPTALAGGGRDEGGGVEPFVAKMAERGGPVSARCPDPEGT